MSGWQRFLTRVATVLYSRVAMNVSDLIQALAAIEAAEHQRNTLTRKLLADGWTARKLAAVVGVSHTTIANWRDA